MSENGRIRSIERQVAAVLTHLDARPFDTLHRPSVDVLFRSAAETFGSGVLGIVMTGMGDDGKEGSSWIKSKGGMVFAEAEESCVVFGMPRTIIEAGLASRTIPLEQMNEAILEVAYGQSSPRTCLRHLAQNSPSHSGKRGPRSHGSGR